MNLNGKFGLIDKNGSFILKPEWKYVSNSGPEDGLILVKNDDGTGFVDTSGKLVIKPVKF